MQALHDALFQRQGSRMQQHEHSVAKPAANEAGELSPVHRVVVKPFKNKRVIDLHQCRCPHRRCNNAVGQVVNHWKLTDPVIRKIIKQ